MNSDKLISQIHQAQIDGLMQERHGSIANTLELCLSCTNQWKYIYIYI